MNLVRGMRRWLRPHYASEAEGAGLVRDDE